MKLDENEFAHMFERLKFDDAPCLEHREALRQQVLGRSTTVPRNPLCGSDMSRANLKGRGNRNSWRSSVLGLVSTATNEVKPATKGFLPGARGEPKRGERRGH